MDEIQFTLTTEYIELFKLLKATDLCESGGMAKQFISDGQVRVNGAVELRKAFKVRKGMRVEYNGQIVNVA